MIDAPAILHDYLSAQSALTALTSTRIWAERADPAPGYKPGDGAGLAFRSRGGLGLDYSSQVLRLSWQFKCYGANTAAANALYGVLVDVLHDGAGVGIRSAQLEIPGQTLAGDVGGTPWPYVLTFFETWMLSAVAA